MTKIQTWTIQNGDDVVAVCGCSDEHFSYMPLEGKYRYCYYLQVWSDLWQMWINWNDVAYDYDIPQDAHTHLADFRKEYGGRCRIYICPSKRIYQSPAD